jgi:hypothetical protein
MASLQSRLDDVVNKINPRFFDLELRIKCKDIGLDPKDVVLVQAVIRVYRDAEWAVMLNARDKTLRFS